MKLGAWLLCTCWLVSGCEVVADFDRDKLNDTRTMAPVPLPSLDGATPVLPEAGASDGALIGPDLRDAGRLDASLPAPDAALEAPDAALETVDAARLDASLLDAEVVAP